MIYRWLDRLCYWFMRGYCRSCRILSVAQSVPVCPVEIMGLRFPNPVGLAAGYDRDGSQAGCLAPAGFGFVEIGTINVISGENPEMLAGIVRNLKLAMLQSPASGNPAGRQLLGISLGTMRDIRDKRAAADYLEGMRMFRPYADYLVVNLSRPGSAARAAGTERKTLYQLLAAIMQYHTARMPRASGLRVPVIVKLAVGQQQDSPSRDIIACAIELGYDGILAAFEQWDSFDNVAAGIRELKAFMQPLPLIVVGGIRTVHDARQALAAGADLVQLYTAFVRRGPFWTRRLITGVCGLAVRAGERTRQYPVSSHCSLFQS